MEDDILTELLKWCQTYQGHKLKMKARFSPLLKLYSAKISFKIIKVAGTNGKGSTSAMLSSCLKKAGLNVGLFTSPHLISITERFQFNNDNIELDEVISVFKKLQTILYKYIEDVGHKYIPTFFEILMLAAIEIFNNRKADVVIFEAGIGGSNDSTSILPSLFSILTTVGLDHSEQLGNTLKRVAIDKTGIANFGSTLIINSKIKDAVKLSIREEALKNELQIIESQDYILSYENTLQESIVAIDVDNEKLNLCPQLKGLYQKQNLNLVIESLRYLKKKNIIKSIDAIYGVNHLNWKGRFEYVNDSPSWLFDSAHNPHAFEALIPSLNAVSHKDDRVLLFGNSEEKDYREILQMIPEISDKIYIVDNFHKAIKQDIFLEFIDSNIVMNKGCNKIESSLSKIIECHHDKLIVVGGSIFMLGKVKSILIENFNLKI